ncbi:amidase [Acuticoccus sediminis]|uniref:amidase n=1 Tax=Acuticoccus sediminis TaxID=2184697 RepID=UPI001CFD7202|nr:amidase [Acuticoccus sediminis]
MEPFELSAAGASRAIADGSLTAEALTRSCLERIAAREEAVKAWIYVDRREAIAAARECDKEIAATGGPKTPLHGIPIGVKDVIDVEGMPTTFNSAFYQDYAPARDAECVRVVRACGAVILGKTDTVEFAAGGRKALTRHPMNPDYSPGGSSSGSAAAVGDRHVPIAFGTQTAGSLIRPASYNGLYALKPTHASVAWPGAGQYAPSLDTIGWYGRSAEDVAMMAAAYRLRGIDDSVADPATLTVGLCTTPYADRCEPSALDTLKIAGDRLAAAGVTVTEVALPDGFAELSEMHRRVMLGEGMSHFLAEVLERGDELAADFTSRVTGPDVISAEALREAYDAAADARRRFEAMFDGGPDIIMAPASPGEAPKGLTSTGDFVMNAFWTLIHVPLLAIPVATGPAGLPIGVQIVAPRFGEPRLIAASRAISPILDRA